MEIGKTFSPKNLKEVRKWFEKNHNKEKEIWFVFHTKDSGKSFVPYTDILDEALCLGWIDSTVKKIGPDSRAQRFTPRRSKSPVSELNKAKMRRLILEKRMTPAGLAVVDTLDPGKFIIPPEILKELKRDNVVWENFQTFDQNYQHLKIKWIVGAKSRPEDFRKRLAYFLKMTKKGKKYGMEQ